MIITLSDTHFLSFQLSLTVVNFSRGPVNKYTQETSINHYRKIKFLETEIIVDLEFGVKSQQS